MTQVLKTIILSLNTNQFVSPLYSSSLFDDFFLLIPQNLQYSLWRIWEHRADVADNVFLGYSSNKRSIQKNTTTGRKTPKHYITSEQQLPGNCGEHEFAMFSSSRSYLLRLIGSALLRIARLEVRFRNRRICQFKFKIDVQSRVGSCRTTWS